jgi:hypothetical protein
MAENATPCDDLDLRSQITRKAMPGGLGEVNGMSDPGSDEVDCGTCGRQEKKVGRPKRLPC